MKLLGLLDLTLLFILASHSNGEKWTIQVKSPNQASPGANVTIPCKFTHPSRIPGNDIQVYWKKHGVRSPIKTGDNDLNAFVFHQNDKYVIEQYRGKTMLVGKARDGNCSLKIHNVQNNDAFYVRVSVNGTFWGFSKDIVRIDVTDGKAVSPGPEPTYAPPVPTPDYQMEGKLSAGVLFAATFTPLFVLVIFALAIGAVFYRKRKRSLTRGESGYYGNVSRATLEQQNRVTPCQSNDHKTLSEAKSIDEPVYVNTQNLKSYDDEATDHTQNIYANY